MQAILTIGGAGAALGFGCGGSSPTSPGDARDDNDADDRLERLRRHASERPAVSRADDRFAAHSRGRSGTTLTFTITVVNSSNTAAPSRMPTSKSGNATRPTIRNMVPDGADLPPGSRPPTKTAR
jgi:hypothetical protein